MPGGFFTGLVTFIKATSFPICSSCAVVIPPRALCFGIARIIVLHNEFGDIMTSDNQSVKFLLSVLL